MFNGLLVEYGGYYGEWMADLIRQLSGHHEPQEEWAFAHLLKRLPPGSKMIELGCFWGFYSLWFASEIADAQTVLSEPDPEHLAVAKRNFARNGLLKRAAFHRFCAGLDQQYELYIESTGQPATVEGVSVSRLMAMHQWEDLQLLHMDVQGAECDVIESLAADDLYRRLRFVVVSTHHYRITGDPLTHERCLHGLAGLGAHIITEHTVDESYSGDGLIVASFSELDRDFSVEVSRNRASASLFRSLNYDLAEHLV